MSLLNAWVRCDQFLLSHDTSHLRALQDVLRAKSSAGASSDTSELSLADHAHTCRLSKKLHVRSGIGGKLGALSQDAFRSLSASQLPIVLDIVRMCCATPQTSSELLHEAVSSSTERELCRLWSEELEHLQSNRVAVLDTVQIRSRLEAVKVCTGAGQLWRVGEVWLLLISLWPVQPQGDEAIALMGKATCPNAFLPPQLAGMGVVQTWIHERKRLLSRR